LDLTPEQIARRILQLLDERHTHPGEYDKFNAITARLANDEISGPELAGGVDFGTSRGWFIVRGPLIHRTSDSGYSTTRATAT